MIFPLLFLIVFGSLEFGLLFKDGLAGSNIVRSGGRALSAQTGSFADQAAMQAMIPAAGGLQGGLSRLSRVVVFIASCADPAPYQDQSTNRCPGKTPIKKLSEMTGGGQSCVTATSGVSGYCNVYSGAMLTSAKADDSSAWGCKAGSPSTPDSFWCPTKRIGLQNVGTDYVGVHIDYEHEWVTGLFGPSRQMSDDVIFRIEPQGF